MQFVLHGTKQLTTSIKFPHPKTMLDSTVTFFCSRTQVVVTIDAFGVTYHLVQSRLKIDVTPIIAYAVTPIRWQKRANYIGARPQQLRRAYQVQLQQNFPFRTFLECICGLSTAAFSCSSTLRSC